MKRTGLSLERWLAICLALVVLLPAAAGAGGWIVAGRVQASSEHSRELAAIEVLTSARPDDPAWRSAAIARLARLGIAAQLSRAPKAIQEKQGAVAPLLVTPGFKNGLGPLVGRYKQIQLRIERLWATLLVPEASTSTRWEAALGTGLAVLIATMLSAIAAARRWIARPLARLATAAEQIAGGDLAIEPVHSPARDVTLVGQALHGMAQTLTDALSSARCADRERRLLVTSIAHDLRTPLFTLRGSLQAIELGIEDKQALHRAQQKAAHLDHLVDDLFTFSRLEHADEARRNDTFDLRDTAQRAVDAVSTLSAARDCAIEIHIPQDPLTLHTDENAVERILINLLDNATQHARAHVSLTIRTDAANAHLEITDDGHGFPADVLPHIFDPFYRADSSRRQNGGTGLGLAIVSRLTTALGGDVTATNRPEGGALIAVTIPNT
jgi:signal transduction histidine kinase